MPSYPYSMRRSVNDSINVNTFKDVSADVFVYNWGPCKWRPVPLSKTPFVSGQAFKKGFFWYDDPARKTEEEIMETTPPLSSSPQSVQEEKIELNSKWLKDNMPRLLTQAMDNPTPENLSRFYTAQRLMLDIGTRFSDKSKDYFLKTQWCQKNADSRLRRYFDAHRTVVEKNQQTVMKDIFTKSGLFFFSRVPVSSATKKVKLSSLCRITILSKFFLSAWMADLYKMGCSIFSVPNAQIIDQFKIREVPTIFLVSKDGSSAQRISEGMITAEELKIPLFGLQRHEPDWWCLIPVHVRC